MPYAQLARAASAFRAALLGDGLQTGQAVLIVAPLRAAAVAAYLGTVWARGVAVLLDLRCGGLDSETAIAAADRRGLATLPLRRPAPPRRRDPLPGVEVAIRDRGGTDELIVTGPHQFHGYLDATHNANTFDGDWVRTGDQADIDDADCLRIRV